METWLLLILVVVLALSVFITGLTKPVIISFTSSSRAPKLKLPPGLVALPVISHLFWFRKSLADVKLILRALHAKHGPVVALGHRGSPSVYVSSHSLAHQALVQRGATFADRPPVSYIEMIVSSGGKMMNMASYGPTWRLLRRNMMAEILHSSRIRSFAPVRKRVLETLINGLGPEEPVQPVGQFQHAMFSLLVLMCFGGGVEENQIREIEAAEKELLLRMSKFAILNIWLRLGKVLFRRLWEEFYQLRRNQVDVILPLIRARMEARIKTVEEAPDQTVCYVDTLFDLELPEEKRKLNEDEMVSLCSEFIKAGTETTTAALQWIMANIVKYPAVQGTLYDEMKEKIGPEAVTVEEEDIQRLPYLKAVVLEGLRRHPPTHFVLPHSVNEDTKLGGYLVPRSGTVNFMVAEMGWDPEVWEDPMAFRPDRFLSDGNNGSEGKEGLDITGRREIKMMPFGAGRRMCPGYGLALLHLEYFVANLVWAFEWKAVEGDMIDLSEEGDLSAVMKNPLKAILTPRKTRQ